MISSLRIILIIRCGIVCGMCHVSKRPPKQIAELRALAFVKAC